MRFLVLGCNGMAGHIISLYLKEEGHDVIGLGRTKSTIVDSVVGDANNTDLIKEVVLSDNYDSVVNCIGILNQYADKNRAEAVFVNSYLPHYLAEVTKDIDTQVIHLSTDCVFSGRRGQYKETDFRDGTTFYDRTKALGELEDEKNITVRTSIIGPDMKENGIGLLNWFMKQEEQVQGYTKAIWTGQTTLQLAKTIEAATKLRAHGLQNVVPNNSISKYDLLNLFNRYIKKEKIKIVPSEDVKIDKSLRRTRSDFNYNIPDYEQMVSELAIWMKNHKSLYPHYDL